ncbi:MAG: hypothetical protein NTY99_01380 [DPANN group archaeon]|nr:hypothetical protein [DPANN group archaeon]
MVSKRGAKMMNLKNILVSTPMLTMVAFAMDLIAVAISGMDAKKMLSQAIDKALPALGE